MEKKYHINLCREDVGKYVIMPGDPDRCELIAGYLDDSCLITRNREYTTYSGTLLGHKVNVTSSGIGGPSTAIAMEELVQCGADTFIRVGTCGGINLDVKSGDIIIATGAVRQEGTSKEYAPMEYPAVANFDVTTALSLSCKEMGYPYHCGVVQCKDSYYGQHNPSKMPVFYDLENKWEAWKRLGVLASEMESAAMFTVGASLGVKCGTVLNVVWNQERKLKGQVEKDCADTTKAITVAIEAVKKLIKEQ